MRVLLVEDNLDLCASLADALESEGFTVDYAYDGHAGLSLSKENEYDVVILDINLPKMNGIELCQTIRNDLDITTPIIMLTARIDIKDKLDSFESGADDYLAKPFDTLELIARLKALVNRRTTHAKVLQVGDLIFDTGKMEINRNGEIIELNSSCRKLLTVLMQKYPEAVSRQTLEHALWGDEPPEGDILKIHIHNLRQKIDKPFAKDSLKTVRGIGYKLVDE